MRLKKGSKVEVLKRTEGPHGSWLCAEILSGNGHNYNVRYDHSSSSGCGPIVERVPRKVLRPRPPPVEGTRNWVTGDIVEVLDQSAWKIAQVSTVVGGDVYIVRLLGCSSKFGVHKRDLRVRQYLQNNQWVVTGKGSTCYDDGQSNSPSMGSYCRKSKYQVLPHYAKVKIRAQHEPLPVENNINFQVQHQVSSRTRKRELQFCTSHVEGYSGAAPKKRFVEQQGSNFPSQLLEKVDAVASPQNLLGEKGMHASCNKRKFGFSVMDAESDACSVASSSSSSSCGPFKLHHHFRIGHSQDTDNHSDDAASTCYGLEYARNCSFPTKEELAAEIRKLELHAYRSTMEALYASGALSWEQEELMTNLRLALHISNDEHLLELRHLVSSEKSLPIN